MPSLYEESYTNAAAGPRNHLPQVIVPFAPWMEIACCVALGGLLLWKGILPGWHLLNTDFPNYYLVARLLRERYPIDRIYDWIWLQRIKDHWGLDQPLVGFAGLTPFSALPIVPFSFFSALVAKRLWILVNVLLLASSTELLHKVTSLGRRRVWLLSLLAVFPLRTSFLYGQMHLLVLALLVLAYFFHRNRRPVLCAFCLGIAGLLKVYPLLFGVYFLCQRRWRLAFGLTAATLLVLGIGYLWTGSDAIKIYAAQVLPRSLQGEVLDPYSPHAASAAALLHRVFIREPGLNPAPLLNIPSLYAVLYPLWQLAVLVPLLALLPRQKADTEQLAWAAFLFALLVLSPVPSSYHFVVMIFSVILLVDFLQTRGDNRAVVVAVVLYCAISFIDLAPRLLAFGRLWIALVLWGVFLFCLWQNRADRKIPPADALGVVAFYAVVLVAWAGSASGYYRHFYYLQQDIAGRMPAAAPVYLSTGIHRTLGGGYVFTAMTPDGYRVLDQAGREVLQGGQTDQLGVASARYAPVLLIELAGRNGSRVLVKPSGESIPNAESPAISPFGTSVAFIREVKGRGTLWLGRLQQGKLRSEPVQIVDNSYDVRDVSFAPFGWIMFAAKMDGRISIFSLVAGSEPKEFLSENEDVDSPAVSPDDRLIAFRKLVSQRWQLAYVDLATGHERVLTHGDCNAYAPDWEDSTTIDYATDCGRGLGLSALASIAAQASQ